MTSALMEGPTTEPQLPPVPATAPSAAISQPSPSPRKKRPPKPRLMAAMEKSQSLFFPMTRETRKHSDPEE